MASQFFSKNVVNCLTQEGEETVKTHISRIRNRLVNISEFKIITIKGLGYKADIIKDK
jgi:DNA-binding response OmpR family regulator